MKLGRSNNLSNFSPDSVAYPTFKLQLLWSRLTCFLLQDITSKFSPLCRLLWDHSAFLTPWLQLDCVQQWAYLLTLWPLGNFLGHQWGPSPQTEILHSVLRNAPLESAPRISQGRGTKVKSHFIYKTFIDKIEAYFLFSPMWLVHWSDGNVCLLCEGFRNPWQECENQWSKKGKENFQ